MKAKQEELDAVKVNFTKVESQLARQELVVLTGSIFTHRQYLYSPAVSLLGGGGGGGVFGNRFIWSLVHRVVGCTDWDDPKQSRCLCF